MTINPTQPLAWGAKVSPEFRARLYTVVDHLGWREERASDLMACMAFETGRTFSPSVRNPGSSGTGLIQFMGATAKRLGTTTAALGRMSAVDQLDYVERYLATQASRITGLDDMYMSILWPAAVGKTADTVLWRRGMAAFAANRGLDVDKNGRITKREASAKVLEQLRLGLQPGNVWVPSAPTSAQPVTRRAAERSLFLSEVQDG